MIGYRLIEIVRNMVCVRYMVNSPIYSAKSTKAQNEAHGHPFLGLIFN